MRIKRALSLLLAVLMLASLLAVSGLAADQLTVITKSNGRRTLAVGETFTYSFAVRLQRPYEIDRIEMSILYDTQCLELTGHDFPNFRTKPAISDQNGCIHFDKDAITNHADFSQSILAVITCTFRVKRGGTAYLRPLIANLEAEAGSNNDAMLVQNYRPVAGRMAFWSAYDYLDENKPTSGSAAIAVNDDNVWFYATDTTVGGPVPAGVKFVLDGTDEDGASRSYNAVTDEYGMLCFQRVRLGDYFVRCDTTNADGSTYLVDDPDVTVPNVAAGELVVDTALSVRSVSADELRDIPVTIVWTAEEIEPGVTFQEDRPSNVYLSLRSGSTVYGQQYVSNTAASTVFLRVPATDSEGQPIQLELVTGAMDQYDAYITPEGDGFHVEFRYKNEHTWEVVRTEPTCTADGSIVFTCTDCGKTYTQTLAALGHDYAEYGYDATCEREGYHRYQCRRCDHIYIETEPKTGHDWGEWIIDKEDTPTEDGLRHHICKVCGAREDQVIASPFHEHDFKPVTVDPTCTEDGYTQDICGCWEVDKSKGDAEGKYNIVPALGHEYTGDSHTVTIQPATCTEDGLEEWTCSRCGEITVIPIKATGHNYQVTEQKDATCTEPGYKDMKCSNCGDTRHAVISSLGHDWGEWSTVTPATTTTEGVKHRFCNRCGEEQMGTIEKLPHEHSYTREEVIPATCKTQGYTKRICPVDGASIIDKDSYTPALGHNLVERWRQEPTARTQGLIDYVCTRCGEHDFVTIPMTGDGSTPSSEPTIGGFRDVPASAWFAGPVEWAVTHDPQITTGVTESTFAPNSTCTRAQTVTFLWRAEGEPEPTRTDSPFTDVQNPDAFFYKAVLWAVENGITDGTSATTFSPNDTVTRAQVVTFLWRAEGSPKPAGTGAQFKDVPPSAYYAAPVQWAVEQNITDGMANGVFAPQDGCTRAQIVTFLSRAAA